jgi:hypothetical protein
MTKLTIHGLVTRFRSGFYDEMMENLFHSTLPVAVAVAMAICFMFMSQELASIRNSEYRYGDDPYAYMAASGPERITQDVR